MTNEKEGKPEEKAGSSEKKKPRVFKRDLVKKSLKEMRAESLKKILSKKECKPKRPISAFFFFTIENRKKIYAE